MGIFFYFKPSTLKPDSVTIIDESRSYDLGKGYRLRFDSAHVPGTQDHLHFYCGKKQLYSMNRDGSGHDGNHGTKMHSYAVSQAQKLFSDFTWPPNNILEHKELRANLLGFFDFYYMPSNKECALLIEKAERLIGQNP